METEMVTITKKEYEDLKWKGIRLDLLVALGVDNWQGYGYPPDPEDYDTEEEWQAAYDKCLEMW